MKFLVASLLLACALGAALAHDNQDDCRDCLDGQNGDRFPWMHGRAFCSNIIQGPRNSLTQRITQNVAENSNAFRWSMWGEHCDAPDCRGDTPNTLAPSCEGIAPVDRIQDQRLNLGVPSATFTAEGTAVAGAFSEVSRGCSRQLIDRDVNLEANCPTPNDPGCTSDPRNGLESGEYTAGVFWTFLNQGDYTFFNCVDLSVARAAGQLNASLGAVILANLFWLLPVALLPVVGAAVYARRHKAESMRASMAAGARMSAVTAAPATGYRSGFTAKNSSGSRMSATTADAATPYKSGFSGMNSQGRNSGVTAAPATPYKSGLTGAADLASANTASTGKSYSSGYTGLSE